MPIRQKGMFFSIIFCLTALYSMAQTNLAGVSGKINGKDGTPLPGAIISVRNESTGFQTKVVSNDKGEFLLKELPLGSPYTVTVEAMGMVTQKQTGYSLNQGDLIKVAFKMEDKSTDLQAVVVSAGSLKNKIENIGAATAVTARDIAKLPVNGRNFTSLMDLSPLSSGSNLSGQLASATNFTIDGMAARGTISGGQPTGAYSITMEAVREFQVVTNQYDVTYGNAGGGTVSTVTKSGTNKLQGSAFSFLRTNWLSSQYGLNGLKRNQKFSTYQYGFSIGGPIIKDKAHFFLAWDHQEDSRPLYIANIQSAADEKRNNVTQATLDQFLVIARGKYGVASSPQFGQFDKKKNTHAVFGRIDWQLNSRNLLTVRDNFIYDMDNQSDGDNTAINIYEVYSTRKSINNSLMASLRTSISSNVTNELKLQHYWEYNKMFANPQLPADNIPRAIVQSIKSIASDSSTVTTAIQLGGQRYGGDYFNNNLIQLVDNLYYNTDKSHFTFGGGLTFTNQNSIYGSETNGRFYFTGLTNFDNLTPYRFARDIYLSDNHNIKFNILAPNVYAQMQTNLFPGFDVTVGVRVDYTDYLNKANFNQTVFNQLGLNTSNKLRTLQVQPRFQATWDLGQNKKDVIRFGAGILGSALNPYSMINNMLFDGSHLVGVDLTGSLVPTPNFPGYRQNPATAPGMDLINNPNIPKLATINMNGKDAKVPTVYKMNASYSHFFTETFRMSVNGYLTFGRNNYTYLDRNMVDQPYFRIAAEGNRGVYVPASTINTTNGSVDWTQGRKTTDVGRVLQLESKGKVNQMAFVVDGSYRYFKDGEIAFSYTWNDSKDNTSYNGNVANTATLVQYVKDDPRDLGKMSYSDNQFRNKIVVYGTAPTFWGVSVGVRFSGISGTRYSFVVNGNVNGDFVASNDLAYVYDPKGEATPQYLKDGINAILANPLVENSAKDYIRKNLGKIAERNGGVNPFYGVLDLRLSKKIKTFKNQYLELSADMFNVLNSINKEWGVNHNVTSTSLYTINGFDPATNTYKYAVNTNAGVSALSGNPYQVQIGVRYGF
ncbi:Carboxypeptidase regulatory-like domain-containing protein [Chitinophaga sp. YR573]|uniref:TonB-dependent receptor n=1 Tax=Chitinophaga sp. YR573 TaxID=1881040 RepID=UPI0008BEF032|nr:carboxypeptidase regulatory-like domain-containing protein [Chitinophaga sp. YR573]SEV89832.1 Carboxypeptidase regulatory-like domain-containing protein [Chitinophaga sp. YR573]